MNNSRVAFITAFVPWKGESLCVSNLYSNIWNIYWRCVYGMINQNLSLISLSPVNTSPYSLIVTLAFICCWCLTLFVGHLFSSWSFLAINYYPVFFISFLSSLPSLAPILQDTTLYQFQVNSIVVVVNTILIRFICSVISLYTDAGVIELCLRYSEPWHWTGRDVTRYTPQTTRDRIASNMGRCSHCFHV